MSGYHIDVLDALGGEIGMSPCPGRNGPYDQDMATLIGWGPTLVLTMTQQIGLENSNALSLPDDLAAAGIRWIHLPIKDFGEPDKAILAAWPQAAAVVRAALGRGERVLFHCLGGCGRTGMMILRLLVEAGEHPLVGLTRMRLIRPCVVETNAQLHWAADPWAQDKSPAAVAALDEVEFEKIVSSSSGRSVSADYPEGRPV